jgi:hypothetical protein
MEPKLTKEVSQSEKLLAAFLTPHHADPRLCKRTNDRFVFSRFFLAAGEC